MDNLISKAVEDFKVQAFYRGKFREVTRQDTMGHWSVFLSYPVDLTFVYPTRLGDLSDFYEDFKEIGCEIYPVPKDIHFIHKMWADASDAIKKIGYPMPGGPAGVPARNSGVLAEEGGQTLRGTLIISSEGKIEAYETYDMGIGRNAQEPLCKVQVAQFVEEHGDQVCLTKRKPGEEMLIPSLDLVGML